MDYTSIHIYGHLLSDDILRNIEQDTNMQGNRDQDFGLDSSTSMAIDYAWSSLRTDWNFYQGRSTLNDPYGTRRARDLMERLLQSLGYQLQRQTQNVTVGERSFSINYLCPELSNLPIIIIGEKISENDTIETQDRNSLDYRAKGNRQIKSPHATMLEYLNSTENVYGIISNGQTLRLIRNSGQLVKVTYIEFDLRRMVEEDKYTEFCMLFRLLHASRFRVSGDDPCVMERWFNMSIESGNRIRDGLSKAVESTMKAIANAALSSHGEGNAILRAAIDSGELTAEKLNKELIHFIYRLLFLFIIEDRNLIYQIPESTDHPDYQKLCRFQELYRKFYAASRLRSLSERRYLWQRQYFDLWQGLMETFRLFEPGDFGDKMGIKPLGGVLFNGDTLHYLKQCLVSNHDLLMAFNFLNEFLDERDQRVKINYSSLDVEEFGSVYEGILEMRPCLNADINGGYIFDYVGGLDRKSTSSYYTRPDLVQNLIRTTLEPVIKEKIANAPTQEEKVAALLKMKVCDAASGSGHIVLAMARTIAWYVCNIRTGEDNPASQDYRDALREVIQRCVYAVDYNPDAVELCKVVLWIEGYCAGKPLSFLDHHIRCGNSVVGVTDLQMLIDGVPEKALTAEDRPTLNAIKKLNREAISGVNETIDKNNPSLGLENPFGVEQMSTAQISLADKVAIISRLPENTLEQKEIKQLQWEDLMKSPRVDCLRRACDIYTYAYYYNIKHDEILRKINEYSDEEEVLIEAEVPYTKTVVRALQEIDAMEKISKGEPLPTYYQQLSSRFKTDVNYCAQSERFFHWCVEFPEVFAYDGGFDVMCGNPPWDKLQMEDEKWFVGKNIDIVNAANQNARDNMIKDLEKKDPDLFIEYQHARKMIASQTNFIKNSSRFTLCNRGKIELSSLFAEWCMNASKEAWGLVCPTSIAFGDSTKFFIEKLVMENRLISIFDFENKEGLFDIHRQTKFCLLTAGKQQDAPRDVKGGFYLTRIDHLLDPNRIYKLQTSDFARFNPNTKTCSIFRSNRDAQLTKKFYEAAPILINDTTGENPWGVRFMMLFNMATHSKLFRTHQQLIEEGGTQKGNNFDLNGEQYVPLYEGKMIWHYNHHYGAFPNDGERPNSIPSTEISNLKDVNSVLKPWYWVPSLAVQDRLIEKDRNGNVTWEWKHSFYIAFRDVTGATNERTCVASIMPSSCGAGDNAPLALASRGIIPSCALLAMMSSIPFDFVARQKVGGTHLNLFMLKQLPFLTPDQIPSPILWEIVKRVAELCYFNHDLDEWAEELYRELNDEQKEQLPQLCEKRPWVYDSDRRALLQAELDAVFAHLYRLSTEDLRYILDPEDVCGEGCINVTFNGLKKNELNQFGEYRTKRLILEAWNRFGYDN